MLRYQTVPVTSFAQNCSIVWCDRTMDAAIIDPGGDLPRLRAAIAALGVTLKAIWLTHAHIDHAVAAGALAGEAGLPIVCPHPGDQFWVASLVHQGRMFWLALDRCCMPMGCLVVCGAATVPRMALTGGTGGALWALVAAQALHALTFASHHTACIAMVTQRFPARLRGRGQALFTVIGYGMGGTLGVLSGGLVVSRFGFEAMFGAAAVLGLLATLCAWRAGRFEGHASRAGAR